jgi:5-methylcytosine-specific restriction endonuclease McrA
MIRHLVNIARAALHERAKQRTRSPKWRAVERMHLQIEQRCAACDSKTRLQVHHIVPFHEHPERELDPNNLITLCMSENECHLLIGHGDNFKKSNPNVVADATLSLARPYARTVIRQEAKRASR